MYRGFSICMFALDIKLYEDNEVIAQSGNVNRSVGCFFFIRFRESVTLC